MSEPTVTIGSRHEHDNDHGIPQCACPEDHAICDLVRAALDSHLDPKQSKIWHRHPVWFLEKNAIAGYSRLKDAVRLMFWSGQSFDAPGLTPSGTFKAAEIRFRNEEEVDLAAIAAWCADARIIQWDYANIYKTKGKLHRLM